jgi:3'-5' exoribonuclease
MTMKQQFVRDLRIGSKVDSIYKIESFDVKPSRLGTTFLSIVLSDKSGKIAAKRWDVSAREIDIIRKISFARVQGLVEDYKGSRQIRVEYALEDGAGKIDPADFEPVSALPLMELRRRVDLLVQSIQYPPLRGLVESFFNNNDFRAVWEIAPAAKGVHHAARRGLMQHTVEVGEMVSAIATVQQTWGYPAVSRDLAVTGALLHDIGKIEEIDFKSSSYNITPRGGLIGHVAIGYRMVLENIQNIPDFPDALRDAVLHIMLSHHGKLEHGSPVTPMLREALIVSFADNLDTRLFSMGDAMSENVNGGFGWHKAVEGGRVYTGSLGLTDQIKEAGDATYVFEEDDFAEIAPDDDELDATASVKAPDLKQISLDLPFNAGDDAPGSFKNLPM